MKRFRIGIIKDLVRQTFLLILVGIAITTSFCFVIVGQSVCAQGTQGEPWEISKEKVMQQGSANWEKAKNEALQKGAEWEKTKNGVVALHHSRFATDIYLNSLLFFNNLYIKDSFKGMKNAELAQLFVDKVKFLIKDINRDAKEKDNPIEEARLLYLGEKQDYALSAPNRASRITDLMIVEELTNSANKKSYCVIKNTEGRYEIAIKLFPIANIVCKTSGCSKEEDDEIIKGCVSCHSILNADKKYEKSDVAGAIVLTFIPNIQQ